MFHIKFSIFKGKYAWDCWNYLLSLLFTTSFTPPLYLLLFACFLINTLRIEAGTCKRFFFSQPSAFHQGPQVQVDADPYRFKSNTPSVGHLQGNFQQPCSSAGDALCCQHLPVISLQLQHSPLVAGDFFFVVVLFCFSLSGLIPYSFEVEEPFPPVWCEMGLCVLEQSPHVFAV